MFPFNPWRKTQYDFQMKSYFKRGTRQTITWDEAMLFEVVIELVNCVMACEKSGCESRAADRVADRAFVPGSPNIL